jgi:hypothetical protein
MRSSPPRRLVCLFYRLLVGCAAIETPVAVPAALDTKTTSATTQNSPGFFVALTQAVEASIVFDLRAVF